MREVLLDFFLSNIEIIGLTTVASAALEFWLQQKFVRDLAKDIDRKYTNYRGRIFIKMKEFFLLLPI